MPLALCRTKTISVKPANHSQTRVFLQVYSKLTSKYVGKDRDQMNENRVWIGVAVCLLKSNNAFLNRCDALIQSDSKTAYDIFSD